MYLSDVITNIEGKLISEGEFTTLNYCTALSEVKFLTYIENPKYIKYLINNLNISCIICTDEIRNLLPKRSFGVFVTDEPKLTFHSIHNSLVDNHEYCLPSFKTIIGSNCDISPMAHISPYNVRIGNNVTIKEFVSINEHTTIEDNCIIHQGSVIGGKSFAFVRGESDKVLGLVDMGQVLLEEGVEICSNCHIARGTLPIDCTTIGKNTKLDAMVHIGHGTKIGKRVFITAGAQIAGNSIIGNDVWIGVNSTISNRLIVEDNARISLGSVVTKNIPYNKTVTGNFAIEHNTFIHNLKDQLNKYGDG